MLETLSKTFTVHVDVANSDFCTCNHIAKFILVFFVQVVMMDIIL